MTKVLISYNPFLIKTQILVDSQPVTSTCKLYDYRNTPMQDWVECFLPELDKLCHDEEIEITFHGLQFNYDALKEQVKLYEAKNRMVKLTLKQEICISQIVRIVSISEIIDEIENQDLVQELKLEELSKAINSNFETRLEVVTISGNDILKSKLINRLTGTSASKSGYDRGIRMIDNDRIKEITPVPNEGDFDVFECNIPFVNCKYATLHIVDIPNSETQGNSYYRYIKKAIADVSKPMILFVIDSDPINNTVEFLKDIKDQIKNKGKQNKERFIFVAENIDTAKNYLYSNFTVEDAQVYGIDDLEKIQTSIIRYLNEYCLIEKVRSSVQVVTSAIELIKNNLKESANRNKSAQNLDILLSQFEQELLKTQIDSQCGFSNEMVKIEVQTLTKKISDTFSEFLNKKINWHNSKTSIPLIANGRFGSCSSTVDSAIREIKKFINAELKSTIRSFLNDIIIKINSEFKNKFKYSDELMRLSQQTDLEDFIKTYIDVNAEINGENNSINNSIQITIEDIMNQINVIQIKVDASKGSASFPRTTVKETIDLFSAGSEKVRTYNFEEGLVKLLKLIVFPAHVVYLEPEYKKKCANVYNENIKKIECVLENAINSFIQDSISHHKGNLEPVMNKSISEIRQKVTEKITFLKEQMNISEDDQKRLDYLNELAIKIATVVEC